MTPAEALQRLKQGNARFIAGVHNVDGWNQDRRRRCAGGDVRPLAAVVGCADARVPVEVVFDAGIGDLFVVRSVAGRLDFLGYAALDMAAHLLEVPLVVVLGHTRCVAVKLALENPPLPGKIPLAVDRVQKALLRLRNQAALFKPEELLAKAIRQNAADVVHEISHNCPLARKRMVSGTLQIVGAIYDVESGAVGWL